MKAHALSLSFFLAVLLALSHPVAVPAAEAQQSQESWQLPWSGSSRPVHAYRGPVREEFLQCGQGQCPLPVHDGAASADGSTAGGPPPAVEPGPSSRQNEAAVRDDAAEVTGQSGACRSRKPLPGKNTIRDRRDHQSRCCREGHDGPG